MEFHLLRPQWLWALVPALALLVLLWRLRDRAGGWHAVIAPDLLRHLLRDDSGARGRNLLPLIGLGWLLAAFAASGPSWQKLPEPVHQRQDALVVLLDLGDSMTSPDLPPSRLARAQQKLLDLLQQRREGQTGLIAYAGDAHVVTPLTDDTPTIANLLPALHPDMMPLPGSEPVGAVRMALELLRSAGTRRGRLLLVTDGVTPVQREGIVQALAGADVQLAILGVGTPGGAPVPLPGGGFLRDEYGVIAMPGLDEQGLLDLAAATGAAYSRLRLDDSDLDALLPPLAALSVGETVALERTTDRWEDQGYLFVLALLPLALALFRRGWMLGLLPALLLLQAEPAAAQSWEDLWLTRDQQGQRALQRGDPGAAAALFRNPDWAGAAAYQGGDYDAAIAHFGNMEDADSLYNRGNALARAGRLDEAIAAYEASLALQPEQVDAMQNLELLRELRDQQQDQQPGDDQQQNPEQDGQQGENSQAGDEGQQEDGASQPQSGEQQPSAPEPGEWDEQRQEQTDEPRDADNEAGQQEEQDSAAPGEQREEAADVPPRQPSQADQPGDQELDQAMEQWLRRVPDDPSGLLRRKFQYESEQRRKQGAASDDEVPW